MSDEIRYRYEDETGDPLFDVVRGSDKNFRQVPANGSTGQGAMEGVQRVPYRLPELLAGIAAGRRAWIVEGEKDADTLHKLGQVATTSPGGATSWNQEFARFFEGARVTICPDRDEPGSRYALDVYSSLHGKAESVEIVSVTVGKDITDHLAAGRSLADVQPLAVADLCTWDPLIELGQAANLPDWPRGCLPPAAEAMVEAVVAHVQVDRRLVGLSALGILAGTVARVAVADVGHTEPLNLWTNAIAETGERKTSALRVLAEPVYDYERRKNEDTAGARGQSASDKRVALKALERAEANMAKPVGTKGQAGAKEERDAQQEALAKLGRTEPTRYACNNGTVEAVCKLMADNNERVLLVAAEPGFLSVMGGQYSKKSAELAPILDAYSGDGGLNARITRESESLTNPALSMVISSQPSRLADLFGIKDSTEQGLAGRFLFSICETHAGYRNPAERVPIPQAVERAWAQLIASLLDLAPAEGKAPSLVFSRPARALWESWSWEEVEKQARPGGILHPAELRGFGSKLAGQVARIAGGLHMCEHVGKAVEIEVTRETVARAIELGRYLLAHGVAAHIQGRQTEAQKVAARIVGHGQRHKWAEFTARDVSHDLSVPKDARDEALHELADRAYVQELPGGKNPKGGRSAPRYVWNPDLGKRAPVVLSVLSDVSGELDTKVTPALEIPQSVEGQEPELFDAQSLEDLKAATGAECEVCGQSLGKASGYYTSCADCRTESVTAQLVPAGENFGS